MAANRIVMKNRIAATELTTGIVCPIWWKMYGSVSKISPGPLPGSICAAKTAGMIANPASRAKNRSERAVPTPETSRFSPLCT